ncbi:MAG: NifB/NifX family molybdenum-iron cluster-binding protein [Candidatus Tectomicrobia bacterium]|uniref:NifB/NifX family molybdenum-iron cluster-binding protein n=1 Tax=Tectimicrobiota bacterium TaxID=2528274 RepID=A0A933GMF5_UNCTE|nr:NifB/NifX family molybdenum-iron cluster-binding protein [Candidatus Tectomicrobia bacterium]
MRVAISSKAKDIDSPIETGFARCRFFILVDPVTMEFEVFEHEGAMLSGHAGIQTAQFIIRKGADALIKGHLGPHASSTLTASKIKIYLVTGGTVRKIIEKFQAGKLQEVEEPTVPPHFHLGGRRNYAGMGCGRKFPMWGEGR